MAEHDAEAAGTDTLVPDAMAESTEMSSRSTRRRSSVRVMDVGMGGPFAIPRREDLEAGDVEMEVVEEPGSMPSRQVQTMPTLPTPPTFSGATAVEKQKFMRQYEAYCRQLSALETAFFRPFRMPVGACVEDERRRLIALFDICKPLDQITETDWIDYFWEGRITGDLDFAKVKTIMSSKLRMDLHLTDSNSRVSKLVHEMYQILEEENMEWMVKDEPKKVVNYLIDALSPDQFQRTIRNEMARESNKALFKDVVTFTSWLRSSCKEYLRWEPSSPQRTQTSQKQNAGKKPDAKPSASKSTATGESTTPRRQRKCLKCGSEDHRVKDCPQTKDGEAESLLRAWREKKTSNQTSQQRSAPVSSSKSVKTLRLTEMPLEFGSTCTARIEDTLDMTDVLLDSGSDVTVVSRCLVSELQTRGLTVHTEVCAPHKLRTFDGNQVEVISQVRLEKIQIQTTAGPLILRHTTAWVFEQETQKVTMILSRPVMERLGYSVDAILAQACDTRQEWDLGDLESAGGTSASQVCVLRNVALEHDDADIDWRTATPEHRPIDESETIAAILAERVVDAAEAGLQANLVDRLEATLAEYFDVFRVTFGQDPPVRVEPLHVRVRADAVPVRCSARRYPPSHMDYLEGHVNELLAAGLAYVNPRSRWASPPRIVSKKEPGAYRMTVDTRAVNERTEPLQWPMPMLEVALGLLEGSNCFFTLDWFRGYWQLPLHPDSQEMFSIMTHRGIITPTRVLMGGTDAVAYCQHVVEEVFQPLLYHGVLAWLDDILGYASDPVNLMEVLERVLAACRSFGLKLHPGKCHFFLREAQWCGKIVSEEGVKHCPSRIDGLVSMADPVTAGQLQQFMCAVNWMRQSIPQYAKLASPLLAVVDTAADRANSRKSKQLSRIQLIDVGWSHAHREALQAIRDALLAMVPLAHPDPASAVCLFTDASQDYWGAVCSQVNEVDLSKPLEDQEHRPLAFLSGRFTGAQLRWPTIEKEAFAIVESAKRLEYLLLRPGGFHLFTDHRNLVYMFDPFASDSAMQRYQADKLQRWAMTMTSYRYVIEHVRGEDNVWADILSRWGCATSTIETTVFRVNQLATVPTVSPLQAEDFIWPTMDEIRVEQQEQGTLPDGVNWSEDRTCYVVKGTLVWIPETSVDLIQRICVVAHAGISGHRGERTTVDTVTAWCWWPSLQKDVTAFVKKCIHCLATQGGMEPRPYGPALHATRPNEVLHFDFLTLPSDENTQSKYVLVLKDDFSGFVELYPSATADAGTCATALLSWFKRFGVVKQWVSDQGSHFRNQVIVELALSFSSQHHFVTAYCPWANGTVEVVNRLLLKCLRAVLSERGLPPSKWESVLGIVQSALNHQPADRLGGRSPLTAFTGLPATTPLSAIFASGKVTQMDVATLWEHQRQHLLATASALEAMHREVASTSEKRRSQARSRRAAKSKQPNFSIGDFVLAAAIIQHPNKLAIKWHGPKRIVRAVTAWIFEVQDLNAPFDLTVHHVSRLRFYADASRGVTEDLLQYALHTQGGHCVEHFCGIRLNSSTEQWEVEVKWLGLEALENTWEPYVALLTDVPVLLHRYCDSHATEADFQEMLSVTSHRPRRQRRQRRQR